MKVGICKLCLQEKELLKQSHIFPEFLCRPWKKKHKGFVKVKIEGFKKLAQIQTFPFVKYMLCEDCDTRIISAYESYIQNNVFLKLKRDFANVPFEAIGPVQINANVGKVKLFLLSILWRSTLKSDYSFVKLGPHEEEIRRMLLNADPGHLDDYPFSIFYLAGDPNSATIPFSNIVIFPYKPDEGSLHINFAIPEFFIHINVSNSFFHDNTVDYPIDENTFIVHVVRGKVSDDTVYQFFKAYQGKSNT